MVINALKCTIIRMTTYNFLMFLKMDVIKFTIYSEKYRIVIFKSLKELKFQCFVKKDLIFLKINLYILL